MANTQYALFSYTVVDELGTKSTVLVPAMVDPTTGTPAALKTAWTALGTDIDAIVGTEITGGRVEVVFVRDAGWKSAPDAGSRVEQTGLFNYGNATTKYKYGVDVPGLADDKISAGKIDLADTDIANFVTKLITSFTGGVFTNTSQYVLAALLDAAITFRKRRKQLSRSSFEVP